MLLTLIFVFVTSFLYSNFFKSLKKLEYKNEVMNIPLRLSINSYLSVWTCSTGITSMTC